MQLLFIGTGGAAQFMRMRVRSCATRCSSLVSCASHRPHHICHSGTPAPFRTPPLRPLTTLSFLHPPSSNHYCARLQQQRVVLCVLLAARRAGSPQTSKRVYTAVGWVASSREIEIEMIMLSRLSQMRNRGAVAQAGRSSHYLGGGSLYGCPPELSFEQRMRREHEFKEGGSADLVRDHASKLSE
eukprot:scaffold1798_cov118-Isochrysis_galbana.AAC.4